MIRYEGVDLIRLSEEWEGGLAVGLCFYLCKHYD